MILVKGSTREIKCIIMPESQDFSRKQVSFMDSRGVWEYHHEPPKFLLVYMCAILKVSDILSFEELIDFSETFINDDCYCKLL